MERELIQWLTEFLPAPENAIVGLGDDAACLRQPTGNLVITADTVCDQVHFDCSTHSPEQIGHKALGVNLSDLAAMGASPLAAIVSLTVPHTCKFEFAQKLFEGMKQLADRHGVAILGGDTCSWDQRLIISITALGNCDNDPWLISTAKPGQRILVTGPLGGSLLGKHVSFEPRCDIVELCADTDLIRAATDISDSLTIDLAKIAQASGVGVVIDAAAIPVSADAVTLAEQERNGVSAFDHALYDGEDFELILAVEASDIEALRSRCPNVEFSEIGSFTDSDDCCLIVDGQRQLLTPHGYEHRFGRPS